MRLVEVIVNVPIRRTFSRKALEGPPPEPDFYGSAPESESDGPPPEEAEYQSFHYHLPPELENIVLPGHLVWAPFGARSVQGLVLAFAESSPVPTRAILRLARNAPVLTSTQLELAQWLAQAYVAPLFEAIRLFLPPGLLTKEEEDAGVRAKREIQVRWVGGNLTLDQALDKLARETQSTRILSWMLRRGNGATDLATLGGALALPQDKVSSALKD
jgi:primosomal protein N'